MKDATGTGLNGGVRASIAHESAAQHVRGCAWYTDVLHVSEWSVLGRIGVCVHALPRRAVPRVHRLQLYELLRGQVRTHDGPGGV